MKYFEIKKTDCSAFRHLVPEDILEHLVFDGGAFAIGVADAKEDSEREPADPVGILLFSIEEGSDYKEALPVLRQLWIYVDSDYRGEGIGTELMHRFLLSAKKLKAFKVVVDIPQGKDQRVLLSFYEKFSFTFREQAGNEIVSSLMSMSKTAVLQKMLPSKDMIVTVAEVEDYLSEFLNTLPDRERERLYDMRHILEKEISTLCFVKRKPVGAFFVVCHASGVLEPVFLEIERKGNRLLFGMVKKTLEMAQFKYLAQTKVRIRFRSERTRRLCAVLYPAKRPALCWHGEVAVVIKEEGE